MISDKKMEDYARDCVRLAQLANDQVIRERLLQMARDWMAATIHEAKGTSAESRFAQSKTPGPV